MTIHLSPGSDFGTWRKKARGLIAAGVPPERIFWEEEPPGLFAEGGVPEAQATADGVKVPAPFVPLARDVSCHADSRRWALLYRLLWRLTRGGERNLLEIRSDGDVAMAQSFVKKVRREIHKMHAFIRFRRAGEDEAGRERYVAWFEPDHWIVAAAAPFFRDRFPHMDWSIFTPKGCAHWVGGELGFTPGLERDPCGDPDMLEDAWRTYYRSIFNPARVKIRMMRSEMPERYWKNLPEAGLIPELIRESRPRVESMFDKPGREARAGWRNAYLQELKDRERVPESGGAALRDASLEEMAEMVRACRRCPLWERATCAVFGTGPVEARLMIVGEQPGDREDLAGQPFAGPAGNLLDQALAEAGIDRSSVYLTNAVKHFKWKPRGKRRLHQNPDREEIEACRPWLLAELKKIAPEVILLLGRTAARSLLGEETKVSRQRGVVEGAAFPWKVILTVHPSFILRQPHQDARQEEYRRFVDDLRLARPVVQGS